MSAPIPVALTDGLTVIGQLGAGLEVWAAPGRVVVEIIADGECVNAHHRPLP